MARKKPARSAKKAKKQAKKRSARRASARKSASRSTRKAAKKSSKRAAKPARTPAPKRAAKPKPKKKSMLASAAAAVVGSAIAAGVKAAMSGGKKPAFAKASTSAKATADRPARTPNLDRPRKTVADVHGIPSSLGAAGAATAAKTGRAEMKERLKKNTSASPALTSGDIDADWESAETVGDEAPGGDNPTPDQDVVDDIGRALGVEYEDDEELQGGAEIKERDRRRWELDPASKDKDEDEE